MTQTTTPERHSHVFLGEAHARNERAVWWVIALTSVMMVAEIVGGNLFGSIALVADGFHMSTHAGAMLLAALAYTLARRRADDPRYTFGTGKFGDLAGFSSALILAMIALGIAYESAVRLFHPRPIDFAEAIPIAAVGLVVNVVSAWLLSQGGHHHHGQGHDHAHDHAHDHDHDHGHGHAHDERRELDLGGLACELSIFEQNAPPRFRLAPRDGRRLAAPSASIETVRPGGERTRFALVDRGDFLESAEEIPEPHAFDVTVRLAGADASCRFEEHSHGTQASLHRDNNMRAAVLHVIADAAVSVLVIVGLSLAGLFGWLWMDPLAGLVGALVIASWSYSLVRDTGRVLLDMNPDPRLGEALRREIEGQGDELLDLHLWRLGPGHLGAILCIETRSEREIADYRAAVNRVATFSHLTIEIVRRASASAPERRRMA